MQNQSWPLPGHALSAAPPMAEQLQFACESKAQRNEQRETAATLVSGRPAIEILMGGRCNLLQQSYIFNEPCDLHLAGNAVLPYVDKNPLASEASIFECVLER